MYDVVIVGAGPAGTAAAYDLLESGLTVLILDKTLFPRKKACAGGITPKGYQLYRYDISSMVKRECSSIRIHSELHQSFTIRAQKTICYMTDRRELDLFSLNTVVEKGAVFKVVKGIFAMEESGSGVELRTNLGTFKGRYLIGADGANSQVRRFVKKETAFKKQFALEADLKVDKPETYPMEFDFSWNKKGYFWIFPKADHLNIGIYSISAADKPSVQDLYAFAENRTGSRALTSIKGYPICTGGASKQPGSNRVLLVGDAAGVAEPLFGEGIYFALKSGQLAAEAILKRSETHAPVRDLYLHELKSVQKDLHLHDIAAWFFYTFPGLSLKIASLPFIQKRFARGYENGNTLFEMIFCKKTK